MTEEIKNNLNNPGQLEKLYRDNKTLFRKDFNLMYNDIKDNLTAQIWNERLNFDHEEISWGTKNDLTFVIVASVLAGLIAKIPDIIGIDQEFFYTRNIPFIVFPLLTAYFSWKQSIGIKKIMTISAIMLISLFYINFLPENIASDTLILACIHLPFFLWTLMGFTYTGDQFNNYQKRLDFLKYNGDLVVMTTIILIAGIPLAGVTVGLFSLIYPNMEEFYFQNVAVFGLAASPIVGTYLVRTNPQLVNKVSPVIAKIFTPLVLITLVVYLFAVVVSGKDPYNDREFLMIFNALLIGVMAIILFSITGTYKESDSRFGTMLIFGLAVVTVIVNSIALSAIVFRISEWGITPNRLAVLGANILILTHLFLVTYQLYKTVLDQREKEKIENSIAAFLPVYSFWTIIVIFVFPVIFQFR